MGSVVQVPNAGPYDLYFVYPMTQEVATMDLISSSFLVAGIILTLLVGTVALVVTRQVVTPVRRAGVVAQRLSAGQLNERMPARGEDDLALLATSFNGMADSLQSQIRQLEGLSAVQQRFVSDVSHELRTPLTTIRMAVDLIHESRRRFDPSVARSAELSPVSSTGSRRCSTTCSRSAASTPAPRCSRSSPSTCAPPCRPWSRPPGRSPSGGGASVTVHAPDVPAEAEVDERRVERILRNLVVNAIEHAEGRPVDIHVGVGLDAVAIVVEDHGVGLRPGEAANVFTRFWRADPRGPDHRRHGARPVDLPEDARLHNGWLQAWGERGVGSRFRLTLPQRAGETLHGSPLRSVSGTTCDAAPARAICSPQSPCSWLGAVVAVDRWTGGAGARGRQRRPARHPRPSPAPCRARTRRASSRASCAPEPRATRHTTTPAPSSPPR